MAEIVIHSRQVEMLPPDALKGYDRNARTHPPQQIDTLVAIIRDGGFTNPILIDDEDVIIAGHGRLAAARKLKMTEVPCVRVSGLTPDQVKALRLSDNQTGLLSGWDEALLKLDLSELQGAGFDLSLTGFGGAELSAIFSTQDGNTDPDDVPEVPAQPVSVRGDVWLLGPHTLVCGDCTEAETVAKALAGQTPHLMVTDSPYGVNYDADWRNRALREDGSKIGGRATGKVTNDDRADWREAWALFPGDVAYVWHGGLASDIVAAGLESCGFEKRAQIIWNKSVMVIGRGHYHWKHEPCQPAGTMVQRVVKEGRWREHSEIEEVPIETLRAGDKVVSFNGSKVFRRGRQITRIGSRSYDGNLHAVEVGTLRTRATAEHQFTVRFDPTRAKEAVLYLMKREDRWRIGVCRLFNSRGFGPAVRLSQEKGESLWILSAHPDLRSARIAEQVASCVYGLPTTHWETDRATGKWEYRTQDDIAEIYRQIGTDRIGERACKLLAERGLDLRFPLVLSDEVGRFSRRQSRIVRACNLVPGIMQVPVPTEMESFAWRNISAATFEAYHGEVYSMDVDQDQHYVADGIITHNCWYVVRKGTNGHWQGSRKETTVWDIDHRKSESGHSTQKPVEAMARPIRNNSEPGDRIYEPFSGSGTTIIAAQLNKRICHAIELEPPYVDVACRRFAEFSGVEPILAETGESWDQVKARRFEVV